MDCSISVSIPHQSKELESFILWQLRELAVMIYRDYSKEELNRQTNQNALIS
jgi:hypothetical protein